MNKKYSISGHGQEILQSRVEQSPGRGLKRSPIDGKPEVHIHPEIRERGHKEQKYDKWGPHIVERLQHEADDVMRVKLRSRPLPPDWKPNPELVADGPLRDVGLEKAKEFVERKANEERVRRGVAEWESLTDAERASWRLRVLQRRWDEMPEAEKTRQGMEMLADAWGSGDDASTVDDGCLPAGYAEIRTEDGLRLRFKVQDDAR